MDSELVFQKFRKKLVAEGILRAALWASIGGFGAAAVTAFLTWLYGYTGLRSLLPAFGVFAAVTVLGMIVIYLLRYRPTAMGIARRLDREMALQERTVTMLELRDCQEGFAPVQRKDAVAKLSGTLDRKLKFPVSKARRIAIAAACGVFLLMQPLSIGAEYIPALESPIVKASKVLPTYFVVYGSYGGGTIMGAATQELHRNEQGQAVFASASEGYYFLGWSDGVRDAIRSDTITEDCTYYAIFVSLDGAGALDDEPEFDWQPDSAPPDSNPSDNPPSAADPEDSGDVYNPHNQVLNGETYYRTIIEQYYEQAMEQLASGEEELSEEFIAFLEAYYKILN